MCNSFTHYREVNQNDPYYHTYELTTTGKYSVSDGKIHCTNVLETYNTGRTTNEYEDKPVDDRVWLYKFDIQPFKVSDYNSQFHSETYEDVIWLQINFNPDSHDTSLNFYEDFAIPFEYE